MSLFHWLVHQSAPFWGLWRLWYIDSDPVFCNRWYRAYSKVFCQWYSDWITFTIWELMPNNSVAKQVSKMASPCFPVSVEKIHILGVVTGSVSVLQYHWFSLASKILIPHLVVITGYNWDEIHSINGVFQFWKSRSFPWFFVVSPSNSSVFIAGILPWQVHQVHRRRAVFVQGHGALTVLKLGYSVRHRTVAVCCLNGLVFIGKILYN